MGKREILIKISVILMAIISCAGCNSKKSDIGETHNYEKSEKDEYFPNDMKQSISETVKIDAVFEYPEEYKSGKGSNAKSSNYFFYDHQNEVIEALCGGKEIIEEASGGNKFNRYIFDDESLLAIAFDNNRLIYSTEKSGYIYNTIRMEEWSEYYNADKYMKEADLDFKTREAAWAEIKEQLASVKIFLGDYSECYIMDFTVMQAEEQTINSNDMEKEPVNKESWSKDDNCYFFKASGEWNGLPVIGKQIQGEGADSDNIKILFDNTGIIALEVLGYYPLEADGETELQSPARAAEKAASHYTNIISSSNVTITEVKLCQKVVGINESNSQIDTALAWECEARITEEDPSIPERTRKVYINAETLDEIL